MNEQAIISKHCREFYDHSILSPLSFEQKKSGVFLVAIIFLRFKDATCTLSTRPDCALLRPLQGPGLPADDQTLASPGLKKGAKASWSEGNRSHIKL